MDTHDALSPAAIAALPLDEVHAKLSAAVAAGALTAERAKLAAGFLLFMSDAEMAADPRLVGSPSTYYRRLRDLRAAGLLPPAHHGGRGRGPST
jgi:hypothetical protein